MRIELKPRVYFQIDNLGRDAVTGAALKKHCQKKGLNLVYGNRILTAALFRFHLIRAFDIVILPRALFIPEFFSKRVDKGHIMVLQAEAMGPMAVGDNNKYVAFCNLDQNYMEGETYQVDTIKRFLLWTESIRDSIVSVFPALEEKLSVVGHPRLDELVAPPGIENLTPPLSVIDESSLQNVHKRVGLISRFPLLNAFDGRSAFDIVLTAAVKVTRDSNINLYTNPITNDALPYQVALHVDEIYKQASDVWQLTQIMARLINQGISVELKIHPQESYDSWFRLLRSLGLSDSVKIAEFNLPFASWAVNMDYVVGPASTSFLECIALGVTPISMMNIDEKRAAHIGLNEDEGLEFFNHIFNPSNVNELVDYIVQGKRLVVTNEFYELFCRETGYPESKSALSNVVEECTSTLQQIKRRNPWTQLLFYSLFSLYNRVYNLRRKILQSKNQASRVSTDWLLDRKTVAFVDSLIDTTRSPAN